MSSARRRILAAAAAVRQRRLGQTCRLYRKNEHPAHKRQGQNGVFWPCLNRLATTKSIGRRLENRRPLRDFAFHQPRQRFWAAFSRRWDHAAEIKQAFANAFIDLAAAALSL